MIAIGPSHFKRFLEGAYAMDEHFRSADAGSNLPLLMGLIGIWHRNICKYPARAIIPYDQRLSRFPAYLQQLDMESNGKRVTKAGVASRHATGPLVWGEPGTNGQHAFFQLLHQGTDIIPVEFLIAAEPHETGMAEHHTLLIANCLAQSQALMKGRTLAEATAQLLAMGKSKTEAKRLAPHRVFTGNRPSITMATRSSIPTRSAASLRFMSTASSSKRQSGHQRVRPMGRRTRQGDGRGIGAGDGRQGFEPRGRTVRRPGCCSYLKEDRQDFRGRRSYGISACRSALRVSARWADCLCAPNACGDLLFSLVY